MSTLEGIKLSGDFLFGDGLLMAVEYCKHLGETMMRLGIFRIELNSAACFSLSASPVPLTVEESCTQRFVRLGERVVQFCRLACCEHHLLVGLPWIHRNARIGTVV